MDEVMAATKGMSVMVWCAMSIQCGMVASTSAPSSPALRPKTLDTPLYSRYNATTVRMKTGIRIAHSGHGFRPRPALASIWSGLKPAPKMDIDSASVQKLSTGLDQNHPSCAHHVDIQSSRARISRATSP
jgi:hypothetical protein